MGQSELPEINVGITGQSGFIGTHLYNTLNVIEGINLIEFEDSYFKKPDSLRDFVVKCDTIVHLAAVNRHESMEVLYETNVSLVEKLLDACNSKMAKPHILFSSSIQEERDNLYGKSKLKGRKLLEGWSNDKGSAVTGLVIPNVFGPFGKPYYNSVVATFCHQITHGEEPKIITDGELKLIYVEELCHVIKEEITGQVAQQRKGAKTFKVNHTSENKVSEILTLLNGFKDQYFDKAIIPNLDNTFERNLFNTFVCYIDKQQFYPFKLQKHADDRGIFVETIKLNSGGQVSFSTTVPGITRGNHYHTRKFERFAVIKGKAVIQLRRIGTDEILEFHLDGETPSFVDMPVWYTHNIVNVGDEDLYTFFWINEHFKQDDPDTYFEKVDISKS